MSDVFSHGNMLTLTFEVMNGTIIDRTEWLEWEMTVQVLKKIELSLLKDREGAVATRTSSCAISHREWPWQ